jgi:hypothetical protein
MTSIWHWLADGALASCIAMDMPMTMLSMELSARLITARCIARYQHLKNGVRSQCTSVITRRLRHKHNLGMNHTILPQHSTCAGAQTIEPVKIVLSIMT